MDKPSLAICESTERFWEPTGAKNGGLASTCVPNRRIDGRDMKYAPAARRKEDPNAVQHPSTLRR